MSVKFSNNGYGTLAASISSSDTSITVDTGQGARFPTLASGDYFYATLIDSSNNLEIIKVTARATDVLTAVRGQDNSTARSYAIGDRIELRMVAAAIVDPSGVSDQANTSTGYFGMPSGTTAQRPGSAAAGYTRYNTTTGSLEFYDGTNWISTNLIPTINSITGTIYTGLASTLTLSLTNATDTIDVKYYEGGTLLATDSGVTVTSGSATSTVPSAVYGQTAGDTISISIVNQDGTPSSNSVNKTIAGLPTGGTITTSGSYIIHTFTSSGTFTVPSGFSVTDAEFLVIAGGGGAACAFGGGGGAGGYRCSVAGESSGGGASAESKISLSANSYTVTVGAGGAGGVTGGDPRGSNGVNSSAFGITSTGGGTSGSYESATTYSTGVSGGSGGGGGSSETSTTHSGGSGTSGQGYAGGYGYGRNGYLGGGGGGAGQLGGNAVANTRSGHGGNGVTSSITGSSVTRGGGGSGAAYNYGNGTTDGTPGTGGGGAGRSTSESISGLPGTANTGGGGGGGGYVTGSGGNGGSGIVIIRYQL